MPCGTGSAVIMSSGQESHVISVVHRRCAAPLAHTQVRAMTQVHLGGVLIP
jgi:hypothetical protein